MYLLDGYKTLFTSSLNPNLSLWEKSVTPPGYNGGGPIEVATMRNDTFRTRAPKSLKNVTEMTMSCAWRPETYDEFFNIMQVIAPASITFPDASVMVVQGWLEEFMPTEMTEGNMPLANVKFIPSMMNAAYVEVRPVIA